MLHRNDTPARRAESQLCDDEFSALCLRTEEMHTEDSLTDIVLYECNEIEETVHFR